MQDNLMLAQTQPFIKLVQRNMELLTRPRFSSSPEMTAQAANLFQQATGSAMNLMQSGVFAQMMQDMIKNYSEFLMELNPSIMAMMSQGQAAMVRQVQEASESVHDVTDVRARRSRQAA
ncbi:MAG TPA: hypothetical protein VET87_12605 [Rubrivivax sp.]|nr:hypothetical protein [Rubrivivax sp.]